MLCIWRLVFSPEQMHTVKHLLYVQSGVKQTYCLNPQHFLWPGSFLEQRFFPPPRCRRLPKRCYRNHVCSFLCDCAVGPRHRPGSRRNRSLSRSERPPAARGGRAARAGTPALTGRSTRAAGWRWVDTSAQFGSRLPQEHHTAKLLLRLRVGSGSRKHSLPAGTAWAAPSGSPRFLSGAASAPKHFLPARAKPMLALPAPPTAHGEPCSHGRQAVPSQRFAQEVIFLQKNPVGPWQGSSPSTLIQSTALSAIK